MDQERFIQLLLESLEHEQGGVKLYEAALECVQNQDLHEEWQKYLGETRNHAAKLSEMCLVMGMDPEMETPGRLLVRSMGEALLSQIQAARKNGEPAMAEVIAAECVMLAEAKDHQNWQLIGKCAAKLAGDQKKAMQAAVEEMENQEDEHYYHTKGWCRELWIQCLGMKAILPPPEEEKHVKSAMGAARAEQSAPRTR